MNTPSRLIILLPWISFFGLIFFISAKAQERDPIEIKQQQLTELNHRVQQEGHRKNHPLVEQSMDAMIELMAELDYPPEAIFERAHLRIDYSLSVNRLASAYEAALAWLDRHPQDWETLDRLGTICIRMHRYDEARKVLKSVLDADPKNREKRLRLLNVLNQLDDREESFRISDELLAQQGQDPKVLLPIIQTYLKFNEFQKALEVIDRLQTILPHHPAIPFWRGQAWQGLGENEKAIPFFLEIPSNDANWADARQGAGLSMTKLGRLEEAAHLFMEILSTYPYDAKTMLLLEQALARLRKRDGFKRVQEIRQETEKIYLPDIEAGYLWRKGDGVEYARLRTIALHQLGQFRISENLLREACASIPESTAAVMNLARFYTATHQACRAVPLLRDLVLRAALKDRPQVFFELAQAYLRQGKMEEAMQMLENSAANASIRSTLQSTIGAAYLELVGDATRAAEWLNRIENPSEDDRAILGRSFLQLGDPQKAFPYLEQCPDAEGSLKTLLAKVECLARLSRIDEADTLYWKTLERFPNPPHRFTIAARAALAEASQAENRNDLAQSAVEAARELLEIQKLVMEAHRQGWPQSIPALLKLSDLYASLQEPGLALEYAQMASEGDPERSDIRVKLIGLMTAPPYIFRRLSQIRIVQSSTSKSQSFDREIQECYAYLELTPPSN